MQELLTQYLVQAQPDSLSQSAGETSSFRTKKHPWTFVHSQFATMGGFEILFEDGSELENLRKALPRGRTAARNDDRNLPTRLTLTAHGLSVLAKRAPHLIPDLSLETIQDKSKGSAFAKTLICFQGTSYIYLFYADMTLLTRRSAPLSTKQRFGSVSSV